MKKKLFFIAVLLMLLTLSACGKEAGVEAPEALPVLRVNIEPEAAKDSVIQRLITDEALLSRLETELQADIQLDVWETPIDTNRISSVSFSGVLLVNDPICIRSLAETLHLRELPDVPEMTDAQMGRYKGRQYGYVLGKRSGAEDFPVLAVRKDLVEKYELREMNFTPASVRSLLEQLSADVRFPLAVYGRPLDEGFALLLNLFEMSPSDGWEFYRDGSQLVYDKLSDNSEAYLRYIRELYESELFPSTCMSLSKYSAIEMLAYGQSAIALFPGEEYAEQAITLGEKNGYEIIRAKLPVDKELLQQDSYRRLVGLISRDCEDTGPAMRFFEKLEELKAGEEPSGTAQQQEYPLFRDKVFFRRKFDLAGSVLPDTRMLSNKKGVDMMYLEPLYCQMFVGTRPPETFDAMRENWLADHSDLNISLTPGKNLLDLFQQWYTGNG